MERSQLTGMLLIFLMMMIYLQFFVEQPKPAQDPKKQEQTAFTPQKAEKQTQDNQKILADSAKAIQIFGEFAQSMKGTAQEVVLENQDVKFVFNTQGGRVKQVILKKYLDHHKKPVVLTDEKSAVMTLDLPTLDKKTIDLYQLFYQPSATALKIEKGKSSSITFTATVGDGKQITQTYTLKSGGYLLDYDIKLTGLDNIFNAKANAQFFWLDNLKRFDEDMYQNRYYTTVNFSTADGNFDYLTWPSPDPQRRQVSEKIHWVSFKQRFFTEAIIAKNRNFFQIDIAKTTNEKSETVVKTAQANLQIATQDLLKGKGNFTLYYGPNRYQVLDQTNIDNFSRNVSLGWDIVGFFARYLIIPLFALLENVTSNYGIILILLVLIVKTLLLPLTYRSNKSMAKMKVINDLIKPDLDEFKKKNNLEKAMLTMEEQQKVNVETQRLYQELGTSPLAMLGGCLPLLLQMPIFMAMFFFVPSAIELRQESFLWAHDLSTYDSILNLPFYVWGLGAHISLFTLLMTLSTLALTYYTNQSQPNLQGPTKYMGYIFPVMFMFILNSSPAGLSFYYLVQNVSGSSNSSSDIS
jgi:YidC/Oxa1 family membrane protein insertase